jgi:LysR family transcriptional regulator, regulator of abg operon
MSLKLQALKIFSAALDEGSLRGAARLLHITQPAVTKAVKELEAQLGAQLLTRIRTGVAATAQGQVLYEHSKRAVQELQNAQHQIQQLGGQMVGTLRIGAVPLAVMLLMPQTIQTFKRDFPLMQLHVSEELYIAQLQRLRKGEVDVAVGGIPHGLGGGEFEVEPLLRTQMVIVVNKKNPLAKVKSLAELAAVPWIYTGANSEQGYARLLFESNGLSAPPVGAVVNSTLVLLSLIAATDFVGLMPEQIAHHPMAKEWLKVVKIKEGGLPLVVGAIVKSDHAHSPAVQHLIAHLHRAAGALQR